MVGTDILIFQSCSSLLQHEPECELMSHAKDMIILNSDKDVQQV